MRKLISMLLLVSMLLSMAVMPAAANETERDLTSREYSHISLEAVANTDVFASFESVAEYSRFNSPIVKSTGSHFEKVTYTVNGEEKEVFNYLPLTKSDGTPITGEEDHYFKGFKTKALITQATLSKQTVAEYVLIAEDLTEENGTKFSAMRYNITATNSSPKYIFDNNVERTEAKYTVKSSHVIEKASAENGNFATILNHGITHKIGPVDGDKYTLNSVYLSTVDPTIQVGGEKGKFLSLLVGTANFGAYNYTVADTAVGAAPKASLNKVTINYEDGTKATKYFIMGKNVNWNDDRKKKNVELSIVYAPKKDSWTADDLYGANKVTAKVLNNANSAEHGIADVTALTSEDVVFDNPDILMTDNATVASWNANRQDTCVTDFGNQVNMANIPLEDKEIASFKMQKFFNYVTEKIPTAITVGTSTSQLRQAFIPVTVKGASEEYDYFAWVCATTDYCALLGASLAGFSLEEQVAMLEERMLNVSSESEGLAIDAEMADLIANTIVEESDFDAEVLTIYEAKKKEFAGQAAEEERLESLKDRKYTYLDFAKDRDVFVNFEDLINYGRFNKPAVTEGSETKRVNEKYTYAEGIELFRYLPHITSDGTPVTGQEDYYFKGFYNAANNNVPPVGERGYVVASGYAYLTDSFFEDDGTVLTGKRVNAKADEAGKSTSLDYYEGRLERVDATKTNKAPTFVQKLDENGYAIIKNGDVQSKIGPISKTGIKPNALRLGNSAGTVLSDVNVKGSSLDLVITSTSVNTAAGYTTKKLATGAVPTATLQEVVINYKDGSFDKKKVLVVNNANSSATDTAYRSIVFAPKYKDGQKIIYTGESFYNESADNSFTMVSSKNLSTIGLTSVAQINKDTVKFENDDIIYSTVGTLASMVNNRMDVAVSNYGEGTSYASIPLQNKEIDKIAFNYNIAAALDEASAITVSNEPSNSTAPSIALIPVEIEGASEDYVYFVYCGRLAQDSYLMAATVMDISAREKIDNAKAAMEAITENSTLTEAKKARELYEMAILEENVVAEKDFGALVTEFFEKYEIIRNKTPLKSETKITFYAGEAPTADVTIINEAEIAGKPYRVMMAYYDEKGIMLDKVVKEGVSTTDAEINLEITKEDYNTDTKAVKVFVWKDLTTILPLSDVTIAEAIEKKIYMFVGASIVQGDHFTKPTELYYMTRFPYAPADFYNKGRGGSTATSIMDRYDWDIQAQDATHVILTVGTNDIGYSSYNDDNSEFTSARLAKVEGVKNNIEKLLGMLENDYSNVIYMLPPILDDRDYTGARAKYTGANTAMEKLGELTSKLAEDKGIMYLDNYAVTKAVNEKEEIWNSGAVEMYSTDRVHPNAQGGYVLAYNVIKNLFPDSGLVAEVVIDATNGQTKTDNADVTDVTASADGVKYTYKAKALPWTYTDAYKKADGRYVDLTNDLNREIIKVTGLSDGTYTLKMDGVTVGTYTNVQLAEGINIANEAYNPGQIQSKNVEKLNTEKHNIIAEIRGHALAKEGYINDGAVDRKTGAISNRDKFEAKMKSAQDGQVYCWQYYVDYETNEKKMPTWLADRESLTEQMREAAMPETHTVEITK